MSQPQSEKKKRKHKSALSDQPSSQPSPSKKPKKSVSYADQTPLKVFYHDESSSTSTFPPVLAASPGLELPTPMTFNAYSKRSAAPPSSKPSSARDSTSQQHELLLHSDSAHPRLAYTAREEPEGSFSRRATRHYVGVYDPARSTLQIVPVRRMGVASGLKGAFQRSLEAGPQYEHEERANREGHRRGGGTEGADEQEGGEEEEDQPASYAQRRTALGEAFGTKKARKAIRSAAANMVAGPAAAAASERSTTTEAVLQSTLPVNDGGADGGGGGAIDRADITALVEDAHPRPTPNKDAKAASDVYALRSTVGRQELELLDVSDWRSKIAAEEEVQTQSRFVSRRLLKVHALGDDAKLKALHYLLVLIRWTTLLDSKGRKGRRLPKKEEVDEELSDVNSILRDKVRSKFTKGSKLGPWEVDRLMLHMCAIALVMDDCTTDTKDLMEDLKLTSKEIKSYYRELGCKVDKPGERDLNAMGLSAKQAADHQVAKLRLPFELPAVKVRRASRR